MVRYGLEEGLDCFRSAMNMAAMTSDQALNSLKTSLRNNIMAIKTIKLKVLCMGKTGRLYCNILAARLYTAAESMSYKIKPAIKP